MRPYLARTLDKKLSLTDYVQSPTCKSQVPAKKMGTILAGSRTTMPQPVDVNNKITVS